MSAAAWLAFVIAASTGAVLRYVVDGAVLSARGDVPWGTFLVNSTGSLVAGFLTGLVLYHGLSSPLRFVLVTGFCGAFTTFSTFTVETVRLIEVGAPKAALRNVGLTLVTCAAAAAAGLALASL